MQSTSKVKTGIEMLTSGVYPVNTCVYIGLRWGVLFQGIFCSPLLGRLRFAVKKKWRRELFHALPCFYLQLLFHTNI